MEYRTKSGRVLTERELDVLAEEAERGYDITEIQTSPPSCDYPKCVRHADWYMVAGTTACGDIIEKNLCEKHKTMLAERVNLPYSLTDTHGHTMEEAMLTGLNVDMTLVFANDTQYLCPGCGAPHLTPGDAYKCEQAHNTVNRAVCSVCFATYPTAVEASKCAAVHPRRGSYKCYVCGVFHAGQEDAERCCRTWAKIRQGRL